MTMMETEDWVGKGLSALANDNLLDAVKCFEMALKRDPLNAGVHNKLSIVHWKLGNLEDSLHHLTQSLEWDPNDREVILHCCDVFRATGRSQDAEEILNAYLERNPWDTELGASSQGPSHGPCAIPAKPGMQVFQDSRDPGLDRCDGTEGFFVNPLKEQLNTPSSPCQSEEQPFDITQFFIEQGEQQFEKGKREHARACFEIALDHNPNCAKAYSNLGVLFWQDGDLEAALEHLNKALRLDPHDFDVLYNSSKVLAAAGELDVASDLLRLYLQNNPKDETAWQDYDAILRQNGRPRWTSEDLPVEVADIYIRMGEALAQAKDSLGAGQAFHRALQVDPQRVEPYYLLGCLHRDSGQESEALDVLSEGLRLHPGHKDSLIMAGKLLVSQGQVDEARGLCEAYASQHDGGDAHAVLEEILLATGQPNEETL